MVEPIISVDTWQPRLIYLLQKTAALEKKGKGCHTLLRSKRSWGVYLPLTGNSAHTTQSVTHGRYDIRPMVAFPATQHRRHLASTVPTTPLGDRHVWTTCWQSVHDSWVTVTNNSQHWRSTTIHCLFQVLRPAQSGRLTMQINYYTISITSAVIHSKNRFGIYRSTWAQLVTF